MKGKTLKVEEYNLTFGSKDRYVNILGFFKYKKNGNLYTIYTDTNSKYEIIYYGTGHLKNNNLLCMACNENDSEIIKEYIFKVFNEEELEDFEVYNLDEVNGLELISSNKLEIKLEVITKIEELVIPKNEEPNQPQKKRKEKKTIKIKNLILLFLLLLLGGGIFYLTTIINNDEIVKSISCTKEYEIKQIKATATEVNTYSFMKNNELKKVDSIMTYKFLEQTDFENFISSGNIFNYMPEASKKYTPNNQELEIEYISELEIDNNYKEPTDYELVIRHYTSDGYSCSEQIEK